MSKLALLFLLIFVGGILLAFVTEGAFAFVVYQIVYFSNPGIRWWSNDLPGLPYSFISVLVMMGLLAIRYGKASELSPWKEQPAFKWMILLLIIYYATYFVALLPEVHLGFTNNLAKLIIIVLIAYKLLHNEKTLNMAIWAYIVGCAYIGFEATSVGRNSSGRVEGIGMVDGSEANDTAAALVPAAVLLMLFAWQGNWKVKMIAAFFGAFIANGLVLINSRGSFLGVVASLGIFLAYMIFSKYQEKGQRGMAILMIIVGLSGAFYVADDTFWERMATLQNTEDQKASGSSRIVFWTTTFDMLDDNPLGLGIKGYNLLAPQYMDDETRGGVEFRSVHSLWFQGLSEIGWHGMAAFGLMMLALVLTSRKAKKFVLEQKDYKIYFRILALECALLGYLAAGSFINRFRAEILYWMILFLMVGIKIYYLNPRKSVEVEKSNDSTNPESMTGERPKVDATRRNSRSFRS